MFVHKREGYIDHKHETVEQARLCERGQVSADTISFRDRDGLSATRTIVHQTPCVCGTYDRCGDVRVANAQFSGNWRDQFRAYND